MFKDLQRTQPARLTNNKRSKLHYLLLHHFNYNVVDELETEIGRKFSPEKRHNLIRRLIDEYKKRPLQDETYEQWHTELKPISDSVGPKRKRRKVKPSITLEDFDDHVKQTLLAELVNEESTFSQPVDRMQPASRSESTESSSGSDSDSEADSELVLESDDFNNERTEHPEWDDETHTDSIYALRKLQQWSTGFDTSRTWTRDRYLLKVWGLENFGDGEENVDLSIVKQHLRSLTVLLNINILRRKWDLAYRIVCLIVRFDVDLRELWPLALEILSRKKDEMRNSGSVLRVELLKEQQFLEWLALAFPISQTPICRGLTSLGPVYRSGTRTYAPIYVITFLWDLLVEQNYTKLRDTIEDLILQPPYSTDGVFHFILALCNLAEAIHLVSYYINFDATKGNIPGNADIGDLADDMMLIGSKDTIRARIVSNVKHSNKLLATCVTLNFDYPMDLIQDELDNILSVLEDKAEFQIRGTGSHVSHEPTSYIFKDSEVSIGKGPNALSGKLITKLIRGFHLPKLSLTSWIREWLEPDRINPDICVCVYCGEQINRTKMSNKKISDHLAQHHIDRTSKHRFPRRRMEQYQATIKDMLSNQDKPSLDHSRVRTYRFESNPSLAYRPIRPHMSPYQPQHLPDNVTVSEQKRRVISQQSNNSTSRHVNSKEIEPKQCISKLARVAESNRIISSLSRLAGKGLDLVKMILKKSSDVPLRNRPFDRSTVSDMSDSEPSDPGHKILEEESVAQSNETEENILTEYDSMKTNSPIHSGNAIDKHGIESASSSVPVIDPEYETQEVLGSPIEEAELEIFKELEQAYSQSDPDSFVRRHDVFSPNTTMDTQDDGNISRNFQEYATQTQEKESGDYLGNSVILLSFSQDRSHQNLSSEVEYTVDSVELTSDIQVVKTENDGDVQKIDDPVNDLTDVSKDGEESEKNGYTEKHEDEDEEVDSRDIVQIKHDNLSEDSEGDIFDDANDRFDMPERLAGASGLNSPESHGYFSDHPENSKEDNKESLEMEFDFDFD